MIKMIANIIVNIEIKCFKHNIVLDYNNSKSLNFQNKMQMNNERL